LPLQKKRVFENESKERNHFRGDAGLTGKKRGGPPRKKKPRGDWRCPLKKRRNKVEEGDGSPFLIPSLSAAKEKRGGKMAREGGAVSFQGEKKGPARLPKKKPWGSKT